jgi:gas vesicle protein
MRVTKRVKKRVKKGIKRVKSAPPEAYLAGAGVLVGGAAVVLLATTKSGRELLIRTVQLTLRPETEEQESKESDVAEADGQESQESDAREDVANELAEDAEAEPDEDTNGDDESRVTDLKLRDQRPRSAAPGRHPRSPRKVPAPAEASNT